MNRLANNGEIAEPCGVFRSACPLTIVRIVLDLAAALDGAGVCDPAAARPAGVEREASDPASWLIARLAPVVVAALQPFPALLLTVLWTWRSAEAPRP
jgi:hypothetical protein